MKKLLFILTLSLISANFCLAEEVKFTSVNQPVQIQNQTQSNPANIKNKCGINNDYLIVSTWFNRSFSANSNDPYVIKINNTKYYMVKNSPDGQYTTNNIIGFSDNKDSLFSAMKNLDKNSDGILTGEELQKSDVRFVALNLNNKLLLKEPEKDFDISNILYIDLKTLRETVNQGAIGSFGYFDTYIRTNSGTKKIIGYVSFETEDELKEMML